MTKDIRQGLIALNAVGVLLFAYLWFNLAFFGPTSTSFRVTELDRVQVIDEAKLQEHRPELAGSNIRSRLGPWIAEEPLEKGVFTAVTGLIVCAINLLLLVIVSISTRRSLAETAAS